MWFSTLACQESRGESAAGPHKPKVGLPSRLQLFDPGEEYIALRYELSKGRLIPSPLLLQERANLREHNAARGGRPTRGLLREALVATRLPCNILGRVLLRPMLIVKGKRLWMRINSWGKGGDAPRSLATSTRHA